MIGVKRKSVDKLKRAQFDVIAVCDDFVLLNETKTSANIEYIDKFDNFVKSGGFYDFYPEYRDIKLVPVFAAIHISEDLIDILTDRGIYSMVPSGNTMDLVNFEKVK